jgi:integrase
MSHTTLMPFQPDQMKPSQLAAVSYLARYSGHTHSLYAYQLRRWFSWCETNGLDPLVEIQRAHVELYIRHLGQSGLMASSVNTAMHAVRGFFRFAQIDRLNPQRPGGLREAPEGRVRRISNPTLDRLELIRFLQVAQTITVHHGALAYLLGINALRASEAAAVRIEDYQDTMRGHRSASGRQGQQARHHANHRPCSAGARSLPGPTHQGFAGAPATVCDAHRPPRRLPDGRAEREGCRDPHHISPHSQRHAAITNALVD